MTACKEIAAQLFINGVGLVDSTTVTTDAAYINGAEAKRQLYTINDPSVFTTTTTGC